MNNKKYKFLEKSLAELTENNIISEEQFAKAKTYFKHDIKEGKSMITIFTSIGIFLVALSIITLFAVNWENIGKSIKVMLAFLPLVITAIMMFFYMKNGNEKLKLYASIFAPISILATNSLIGQIFHIQMETYELFYISLLSYMPIAFILRNYLSLIVYCIGAITYVLNVPHYYFETFANAFAITLPIIIYNYINYRKELNSKKNTLMWVTNVLVATMMLFEIELTRSESIFIYGYLIYLVTKMLFGSENILSKFLKLIFVACMFVFCFEGVAIQYEFGWGTVLITALLIACMCIGKMYKEPKEWFLFAFIALIQYCNIPDEILYILVNLLVLALGIYKIVSGSKNAIYKETKQGVATVVLLIMFRFMSSDLSFTEKSVVFLISGIAFIIGANILKKRIGGKNNE